MTNEIDRFAKREEPPVSSDENFLRLSLVDLLSYRASSIPHKLSHLHLRGGEEEEARLTYFQLDQQARAIAAALQDRGVSGKTILLAYPPGLDFIAAFFGCLYAGAIAVPVSAPMHGHQARSLARLLPVIKDADVQAVLTTEVMAPSFEQLFGETGGRARDIVATENISPEEAIAWRPVESGPDSIAFLQYTSGSTGTPKGVVLTHGNFIHNASVIHRWFYHDSDTLIVSWLPTFHDMGLMVGLLLPVYAGGTSCLMSPVSFIQRPLRWLEAVSRYKSCTSGGPNFAYDLCTRKITPEELERLDLSNWNVAFNGAEPVRLDTLDRFAEKFAPAGFRREAFLPCYGLAEGTLIVSGIEFDKAPVGVTADGKSLEANKVLEVPADTPSAKQIASCGPAVFDQVVKIVDHDGLTECREQEVGEIWVKGPSVAHGYWNSPEETARVFGACISPTNEGPFLRTGDYGFIREGHVYVTGRIKDLIIVRGANHYPQDIEFSAQSSHPALVQGSGAAFPVDLDDQERVVLVQEINQNAQFDAEEVIEGIRVAVAEENEISLFAVVLIKRGTVPKTTSGKIQRRATRAKLFSNKLDIVAQWQEKPFGNTDPPPDPPSSRKEEIQSWLVTKLAQSTGVEPSDIDPNKKLTFFGIDSMGALELEYKLQTELGLSLPRISLFRCTVADLAATLDSQPPARPARSGPEIPAQSQRVEVSRLSRGQQGIWFVDQLSPGTTAYNIARAILLPPDVNTAALIEAVRLLVYRHEALRTTFEVIDGVPHQRIHDYLEPEFITEELNSAGRSELDSKMDRIADRPFDLGAGPLLRVGIFERPGERSVMLLVIHHIATDFWSLAILIRELDILYGAALNKKPPELKPCRTQYRDFVAWQEQFLTKAGDLLWDYWRNQLEGAPPVLELPIDKPRPTTQSFKGASHQFTLSAGLTSSIKELCRTTNTTPFIALLAAFQALLHRYSGSEDFVVGSPTYGRPGRQMENTMGYFINPILLRARIPVQTTFQVLLEQTSETVLSGTEHQSFPFELVVERLHPQRDASRSPLFQVMFIFQKPHVLSNELSPFAIGAPGFTLKLPNLTLESAEFNPRSVQFDLLLMMAEVGDSLRGSFEYSSDLFDLASIERMEHHLVRLIESMPRSPDRPISDLPMLSGAELLQLTQEWNSPRREISDSDLFVEMFGKQATVSADGVCVSFNGTQLTYRTVYSLSCSLSGMLVEKGLPFDGLAGLCIERSPEFLIGMLSVFMAGGAYAPLDPEYPRKRVDLIVREAALKIVLTTRRLASLFNPDDVELVLLNDPGECSREPGVEIAIPRLAAESLAYVIYTSGSTGAPKGAMVNHAGMINHLIAKIDDLEIGSGDVIAQTASQCFDISVWQFLSSLLVGGRVEIFDDETIHSPESLLENVSARAVTILETVPSMLRAILEIDESQSSFDPLRWLVVTGEKLPPDLVSSWLNRAEAVPVMNAYGPTECSDDVTHFKTVRGHEVNFERTPIGRALPNVHLYPTRSCAELVPAGHAGELHVGGLCLGRGYLKNPSLTAESFIPSPFGEGERLYRTGDLARYLPDGNIDFIGRADKQVKVRGFRIELGEIEACISRHADVEQTVVLALTGSSNETRLVAYVTTRKNAALTGEQIRDFLRDLLPEYMAPHSVVFLDSFPLTPNGKIDAKALPRPSDMKEGRARFVEPAAGLEQELASIWAEVLGIDRIGVLDNFFELGGDSISTIRIVSRAARLGFFITPKQIFQNQTVQELVRLFEGAAALDQQTARQRSGSRRSLPVLSAGTKRFPLSPLDDGETERLLKARPGAENVYSLSPMQEGILFHSLRARTRGMYSTASAFHLNGALNLAAFHQAWQSLISRCDVLRTAIEWDGPSQPVQIVYKQIDPEIIEENPSAAAELKEPRRDALDQELDSQFDLSKPPLFRVRLSRIADERYEMTLAAHHILMDGWGLAVLVRELFSLYEDSLLGRLNQAAALPQYADYIGWLQKQDQNRAADYWGRKLAGVGPALTISDREVRGIDEVEGHAREKAAVSAEVKSKLEDFSRRNRLTLNTVTEGAFAILLGLWSSRSDVMFGAVTSGRPASLEGVDRIVGLFINTLPVAVSVSPAARLIEWLNELQNEQLEIRDFEHTPLAEIKKWAGVGGSEELFDIIFVFENFPVEQSLTAQATSLDVRHIRTKARSHYGLAAIFTPALDGLEIEVVYDPNRYERDRIRVLLRQLVTLIGSIANNSARNPEACIGELSVLDDTERSHIIHEWNRNEASNPSECVHELFTKQARRTAKGIAVQCGSETLTYDEIDKRSNRVANLLKRSGVGRGQRIGIYLNHSPHMPVAVLGVLKSGAAYVPFEPAHPLERNRFILEDAGVEIVLSEQILERDLSGTGLRVISLDGNAGLTNDEYDLNSESEEPVDSGATPEDLAYVIYTSGSTGRPKGVKIQHKTLTNYISWARRVYSEGDSLSYAVYSSLAFDLTVTSIFTPLVTGGKVVIYPKRGSWPVIIDVIADNAVDVLKLTPSHLALIRDRNNQDSRIKKLIVGGEALGLELAEDIFNTFGRAVRIYNEYGPTEATVGCMIYELRPGIDRGPTVPIGRPASNTQIYLLNEALNPVGDYAAGEIFISGAGLAAGYLNRDDLTSERFIENPFSPGQLMYRTGDLGRRIDGTLEYLGRKDEQVKFHGYRVELNEIRANLLEYDPITDAAVLVGEDEGGNEALVAYCVSESELDPTALREFLKDRLIEETIPTAFVHLASLPLTINGKVDREALKSIGISKAERKGESVALGFIEEIIAQIWAEALATDSSIDPTDGFYRLGGNDDLADKAIDEINAAFQTALTRDSLVAGRTLRSLSLEINRATSDSDDPSDQATVGESGRVVGSQSTRTIALSPIEELLSTAWSNTLGIKNPALEDNFFEKGGHSLMVTRLVSRIRNLLQIEVPLQWVFEAPTISALARKLSEEGLSSLSRLIPAIRRAPREKGSELSYAQRRLWFLAQMEPDSAAYNIPGAVRIRGRINIASLESAMNEIIRRHENLRSSFIAIEDEPLQVIQNHLRVNIRLINLEPLSVDVRENAASELMRSEASRHFDLTAPPLLRAFLLTLTEDDRILLLNMHHVISDGWSLGVLLRELKSLYYSFAGGVQSALDEIEIQYVDYAVWQRDWLAEELIESEVSFWKPRLDGFDSVIQLPADRPRPRIQSLKGAVYTSALPVSLTVPVTDLKHKEGVTLFMVMTAAFGALLSRLCSKDRLTVGSPIANRTVSELEGLIGFFANTLVLNIDLSGRPTFHDLLSRVRRAAIEAYRHKELPFELLVERLNPERDLSVNPLFQVMLVLQDHYGEELKWPDLDLTVLRRDTSTAKFDLTLFVEETDDRLLTSIEYNSDIFDRASIKRIADQFSTLMLNLTTNPAAPVSELPLLAEAQQHQIVYEWNDSAVAPDEASFTDLFEEQARLRRDAIAASAGDFSVSYRELCARADYLSGLLRDNGVGPEIIVGVCMERGISTLIAMLAILKSGGVYLPIDPEYPDHRLTAVQRDSQPAVLIGEAQTLSRFTGFSGARISIEDPASLDGVQPESSGQPLQHPHRLAYIIYTSGSTGVPKGAIVEERGMVNHLRAKVADLGLNGDDVVAQTAPQSFDISIWQFLSPLLVGGRVSIIATEIVKAGLLKTAIEHNVTILEVVPSLLQSIIGELAYSSTTHVPYLFLRWLLVTGEALPPALCSDWLDLYPSIPLLNAYGPTECSDDVSHHPVYRTPESSQPAAAIGRPVLNTRLYVLDASLGIAPIRAFGELFAGGMGVGRGYLERPDKTAEAFIPDPFAEELGGRLYRTGDLARLDPDGNIDFVGRIDGQVKIRGHRIELGEIESAISSHPAIREAVVSVDGAGDRARLAAYFVIEPASLLTASDVNAFLKDRLPGYMLPSAYIELETIPLTAHGKVDRRALPAPVFQSASKIFEAPLSPIAEMLTGIWSESLRLTNIAPDDNFFELGGHSLLATQVVSRIKRAFSIEVPLRSIFEYPTIKTLAGFIENDSQNRGSETAPSIGKRTNNSNPPLSFAQERLWFLDKFEPQNPAYNLMVAVRVRGDLNHLALGQAVAEIIRRHEVLRTGFVLDDVVGPLQVISNESPVFIDAIDLTAFDDAAAEAEATTIMAADADRGFDLSKPTLLRVKALKLKDDESLIVLTMHHIVGDGWSLGIWARELRAIYEAYVAGFASPLEEPRIQYADFAVWQREWLQGETLETQLRYWREHLRSPPVIELPTDRPRPDLRTADGGVVRFSFGEGLTSQLRLTSRREHVTLFMTLLAGLNTLFYRYSGQEDVVVGTPIANRNREEIEDLIGFFVNTLAIRTKLNGNPDFRTLLGRIRELTLGAYAHQDVPFERLVEELDTARDLSRTPLFQVMLVLQNAQVDLPHLGGATVEAIEAPNAAAKFDLSMILTERGEIIEGEVEYSTDIFEADTIERFAAHYIRLLEQAAAAPAVRISEYSLLTAAEHDQLLIDWNSTEFESRQDLCINQLIEEQAGRTPDAIAVVHGDSRISYSMLSSRSNMLARYLRRKGVGPESRVGIMMRRSADLILGILAVLKAGGAYVPLDPNYPENRVRFMLDDSGAELLLTDSESAIAGIKKTAQVSLAQTSDIWSEAANPLDLAVSPRNLAYLIYTSGSTGIPKGVAIEHRSAAVFLQWAVKEFSRAELDAVLASTSICFDLSVFEMFAPLTCGGRVLVLENALALADSDAAHEATLINTVPSAIAELAGQGRIPNSIATINLAGEALKTALVEKLYATTSARDVVNLYGPSEYTTYSTFTRISRGAEVTIGRPVGAAQIYVLDEFGGELPVNIPGDLHVAGMGLARGYFDRPELTAERFLPNPFAGDGARMYKTGDAVRYQRGGEIEYIGRQDYQVKIRGHRIELGEVEANLCHHPSVKSAAVIAQDGSLSPGIKILIAHCEPNAGARIDSAEIKAYLRARVPEFMIPSVISPIEALPLTPNGKVDRRALTELAVSFEHSESEYQAPVRDIEKRITDIWKEVLGKERIGVHDNFFDVGGHSLLLARVHGKLSRIVDNPPKLIDLFRYPSIHSLAAYLEPESPRLQIATQTNQYAAATERVSANNNGDVAIIGMAGRFPGARNINEFWRNISGGVESVTFFSDEEVLASGVGPELLSNPNYVKAEAVMEGAELFDAKFFGYTPREAEIMDPQHRHFLECAWEALENAGYDASRYQGPIGVFAGVSMSSYLAPLYLNPELAESYGLLQVRIGNGLDFVPTRVSYKLNLRGPSVNVQTACSTSLVAAHLAYKSLLAGECDMAMAGGVSVSGDHNKGYIYTEGGVNSPDGHCRAFDARAAGTLDGNGVGIVVLKRLADALADRDHIYAVIKGSAINNDGLNKVGYTAPSSDGQAEAIRRAQSAAGVEAGSISYIEAHGTATILGDPIELAGLNQAFEHAANGDHYCALGSVKTNIGHLDAAAGVTGLIKTALALHHEQIPPSLHFETPNPNLNIDGSAFYVNTELKEWQPLNGVRRAGVSSFGIGGTNAHVILEEAPSFERRRDERDIQLIVLSAKTADALEAATGNLADHLMTSQSLHLGDVAFTLQMGREAFDYRRVAIGRSADEVAAALASGRFASRKADRTNAPVAFIFPGGGSQFVNMGWELYQKEPIYRQAVDYCSELLLGLESYDIRDILYPNDENELAMSRMKQTTYGLPALFIVEYAMARMWISWGVAPCAMIGHSLGEYTAACVSGVLSVEDALALVAYRAKLIDTLPSGAMLSVSLAEADLKPILAKQDGLSIAAINGPNLCVAAGSVEEIAELERELTSMEVENHRIKINAAGHSTIVEPIMEGLGAFARTLHYSEPLVKFISNVTGNWVDPGEVIKPDYWIRHLRSTVRFAEGLGALFASGQPILLEVGPGQTLSNLARQQLADIGADAFSTTRHVKDRQADIENVTLTLGKLWLAGVDIDWPAYHGEARPRRVPLPTYPFQRQRYWLEAAPRHAGLNAGDSDQPTICTTSWKRGVRLSGDRIDCRRSIIFLDELGIGAELFRLLNENEDVITVETGKAYERVGDNWFSIDPLNADHYRALFRELHSANRNPERIVHMLGVTLSAGEGFSPDETAENSTEILRGLIMLADALEENSNSAKVNLEIVTNSAHRVISGDNCIPHQAAIVAAAKILPMERPNISARSIDLAINSDRFEACARQAALLLPEIKSFAADQVIALRGKDRWVQSLDSLGINPKTVDGIAVGEGGVYLITRPDSPAAVSIARYLAGKKATLVLARSPNDGSTPHLESNNNSGSNGAGSAHRLVNSAALEELGAARVVNINVALGDEEQLGSLIERLHDSFGGIDGIVHFLQAPDQSAPSSEHSNGVDRLSTAISEVEALARVVDKMEQSFCLVYSNGATDSGIGDCAAALFSDSFAEYQREVRGRTWISLLAPMPDAVDISIVDISIDAGNSSAQQNSLDNALTPAVLFRIALAQADLGRIIVKAPHARSSSGRNENAGDLESEADRESPVSAKYSRPLLQNQFVAPTTTVEKGIARAWSELLGIDQIGIEDNFFELGGHSLLATRVMSRIRESLKLNVPLKAIFETPTIAGLAGAIGDAAPASDVGAAAKINKIAGGARLPLSYAQERLWFMHQINPANPFYNIPAGIRLEGALNLEALRQSFNEVVRRHEILRTRFSNEKGECEPLVARSTEVSISLVDIRIADSQKEALKNRVVGDETARPFRLSEEAPLRVKLIRLDDASHLVLITMHHMVSDGWSVGILVDEISQLYQAFVEGRESALSELSIQYVDYAAWQRTVITEQALAESLEHWRRELSGDLPSTRIPSDRRRPSVQTYRGSSRLFSLDEDIRIGVKRICQRENATEYMTMLTAFAVLLSRYCSRFDTVVGTGVANRSHPDVEDLIGFFVNTLALRIKLNARSSFTDALRQVKETAIKAFTHQALPFEQLVEALQPGRDPSSNPFFNVFFITQNAPSAGLNVSGLKATSDDIISVGSKFDFSMMVMETEEGLKCGIEFSTDLFDETTIERIFNHYATLLGSIVRGDERDIGSLEILGVDERRQLLFDWASSRDEIYDEIFIHELIEAQARSRPDAVALVCENQHLSYEVLNVRANAIALLLIKRGAAPETRIGVCIDRSLDMIAAVLGVLRSGGAYVPMDPSYPGDRLSYIAQDSGIKLLVSNTASLDRAPRKRLPVINVDKISRRPARRRGAEVKPHIEPANLAYLIYTSGSTGLPKGVMVSHGGIVNLLRSQAAAFDLRETDRVIQFSSLSFDASVFEIVMALGTGACLVMAERDKLIPGADMIALLKQENITNLTIPPSVLGALPIDDLPSLRLAIVAGEDCPEALAKRWGDGRDFFNAYGPTEATVWVSAAKREQRDDDVSIGKPIFNTRTYALDRSYELAPIGIPGELYTGGAGIARGYLNKPDLTAESFLPNPFSLEGGAILYKTGDQVRWRASGNLDFIGRVDSQVKVRGFRIEIGEIENSLLGLAAVREAAASVKADANGNGFIAAYIVPIQPGAFDPGEARRLLRDKLPEYMIPNRWVVLGSMPLMPSGKVDRNALPDPSESHLETEIVPPRSAMERRLVSLWEEVLAVTPVGIRTSFFELGGHSLLALKLTDRIQSVFGVKLELRYLFQYPTVEELARVLEGKITISARSALVPMRSEGTRSPFFCIHPLGGDVLCYRDLARFMASDRPFYAVQAPNLIEVATDGDNFNRIEDRAASYVEEIRSIQPQGPYFMGGWSYGGILAFEMAQQLAAAGQKTALLALFDSVPPTVEGTFDFTYLLTALARELSIQLGASISLTTGDLADLTEADQCAKVLDLMARAGVDTRVGNVDLSIDSLGEIVRAIKSRVRAVDEYEPRIYSGRITLFKADTNPDLNRDEAMREMAAVRRRPAYLWDLLSSHAVRVENTPGYHETMLFHPNVELLAKLLDAILDESDAGCLPGQPLAKGAHKQ